MSVIGTKSNLITTRSALQCLLFGAPSELNGVVLPTTEGVLKCYLFTRQHLKVSKNGKDPPKSEIISIREKIEEIGIKASIPVISSRRIDEIIVKTFLKYQKIIRFPESKRNCNYENKVKIFKEEAVYKHFDISACKCEPIHKCKCEKSKKVPLKEREFFPDQRSSRKMYIGTLDKGETKKMMKRQERKAEMFKFSPNQNNTKMYCDIDEEERKKIISECKKLEPEASTSRDDTQMQMKTHLPTVSRISDQYGVSDRCVAAIASAVLQDIGILTDDNFSHVIDRSKIRRARKKTRQAVIKEDRTIVEFKRISFCLPEMNSDE